MCCTSNEPPKLVMVVWVVVEQSYIFWFFSVACWGLGVGRGHGWIPESDAIWNSINTIPREKPPVADRFITRGGLFPNGGGAFPAELDWSGIPNTPRCWTNALWGGGPHLDVGNHYRQNHWFDGKVAAGPGWFCCSPKRPVTYLKWKPDLGPRRKKRRISMASLVWFACGGYGTTQPITARTHKNSVGPRLWNVVWLCACLSPKVFKGYPFLSWIPRYNNLFRNFSQSCASHPCSLESDVWVLGVTAATPSRRCLISTKSLIR